MIRTAILAAMLLVMLSMAYSRTGQLPDLRTAQEPAKVEPKAEPQVAALSEPAAPSPRAQITVRPGIDPASPMTPIHATVAKTRAAPPPPAEVAAAPAPEAPLVPTAVPQVAPVVAPQPAPVAVRAPAPVAVAQPAPTIQEALVAPASVAKAAPKVEDASAEPVVAVPAEPVVAKVTPVDEMPVKQVATPRVMMPRDLPLPSEPPVAKIAPRTVAAADMMDDGFPAPPAGSNVTSAPAPKDAATKKPADAPQFMSREERTRELYRLAREMEDTFISKLAH